MTIDLRGLLATRARGADVPQGEYVASLIEGTPLVPKMPDRADVLKALCQSTSNLAALAVHLHALADRCVGVLVATLRRTAPA